MLIWALLITMAVLALSVWVVASGGHLFDFAATSSCFRQNFRWWHPLLVVAAVFFVWLFTGLAAHAGTDSVINGYKQFINGSLVSANVKVTDCHEDGSCYHTHPCDSYQVTVVDKEAYTDDNGDYHPEESHQETRHHDCPYVTREYRYWVTASFGYKAEDYTIANRVFEQNPQIWHSDPGSWFLSEGHHYHTSHGIPPGVFRGVPPEWKTYRDDIARGDADPVTDTTSYTNYVLASKDPVLSAYSDKVPGFLAKKLLPEHTAGMLRGNPIQGYWDADKFSFVGFHPANTALWQARLMRFNSALGMERQGDLHMVAVSDQLVSSAQSEDYLLALKAYWEGPKFGKKALAKNGIIVVLGVNTSSNTIDWARAQTGMPVGNGEMLSAIEIRLPGKPFDPGTILGKIRASVTTDAKGQPRLTFKHGNSVMENIIFRDHPFARARMGKHAGDKTDGDFTYLKGAVKLRGWVFPLDIFLAVLIGLIAAASIVCSSPAFSDYSARSRY